METPKPTVPKMKYSGDEETNRKMMSLRLPEELVDRLKEIASEKGWSLTMLIQMVLDQYAQHEDKGDRGRENGK
jgi:predicted DNA binding CopG/RHH family protein